MVYLLKNGQPVPVAPGIEAIWAEAGHMLGSASIRLSVQEDGTEKTVVFSGDLGPRNAPILKEYEPFRQAMYSDLHTFLGSILDRNDRMTMGASIECRVPFLDYRLVEFVETLPPHLKLKGFHGKYLHKKAIDPWLPKGWTRKKKKGFSNPITKWFRGKMGSYVEECFGSQDSALRSYFNPETLNRIFTLHRERKENYLRHIDLLISFELWHRRFIRSACA